MHKKVRHDIDPRCPIPDLPDEVTKSCGRTLRILEYIDDVQRPVAEIEFVDVLGYPQSSVASLLKSLVKMGYLSWDASSHSYAPTLRVQLLGHWMEPNLMSKNALLQEIDALAEQTGQYAFLVTRQDMNFVYIYIAHQKKTKSQNLVTGTSVPLVHTTSGIALLSTYSDKISHNLIVRAGIEQNPSEPPVDIEAIKKKVSTVQKQGYAFDIDPANNGGGVISMPLTITNIEYPLAVSLGGDGTYLLDNREELVTNMRQHLADWL